MLNWRPPKPDDTKDTTGLNLVIPMRADIERDAVARAWQAAGGTVTRLDRYWRPPPLERDTVRLYGPEVFVMILAQLLELTLVSPADDALYAIPAPFLRRTVDMMPLAGALRQNFPVFVKSVTPKQFAAAVYDTPEALQRVCEGLDEDTAVFVGEPVRFAWEARAFVCGGTVLDVAAYEGTLREDDCSEARAFVELLDLHWRLPDACVVDIGAIEGRGIALVELNAAWGAGLNGCDPARVLPAIAAASHT